MVLAEEVLRAGVEEVRSRGCIYCRLGYLVWEAWMTMGGSVSTGLEKIGEEIDPSAPSVCTASCIKLQFKYPPSPPPKCSPNKIILV